MANDVTNLRPLWKVYKAVFAFLCLSIYCLGVGYAQDQGNNNDQETSADETSNATPSLIDETSSQDASSPSVGSLSAQAWMQRLAQTVNNVSFEISFVVTSFGRETMPYVWRHAIMDNGDNVEQLSLLNGPGFEQIRINNKVSIFEPGFASLSIHSNAIDGPIPNAFIRQPDALNLGYDILLMGRNRISGRMAQQIRVISKDKSRYQYHLWLDEQTGLLLKLNMYSLKGDLLKQIQVTQLTIDSEIKDKFSNISVAELPPITVPREPINQQLPWTVSYVPVGMKAVTQNLRRIALSNQPAEYLMLSDGLADVSIYVTEATDASQEDIAVNNDTRSIVSISDGRLQVTVIGEIPIETASKIANSIVLI